MRGKICPFGNIQYFFNLFVTCVRLLDNPWDQATQGGHPRNETSAAIADARRMTEILKEINADGVFGDGNGGGNSVMSRFFQGGLATQHPAALQAESGGSPTSMMNYTTMGWGCEQQLRIWCICGAVRAVARPMSDLS